MISETWVWIHLPGALKPTLCVYGKSYLGLRGVVSAEVHAVAPSLMAEGVAVLMQRSRAGQDAS